MSEKAVPCQLMELLYLPPMYMTVATGLRKRQRMRDSSQRLPITAMTTTEIQSASTQKQSHRLYCGNDPVLFTDPTGHITQQDKDKYKNGEINFYQWQTIVAIGEKWDSVNNMKDLNGEAKALARKEIHELADNFRQNGYHWESGDNLVSGDRLPDFWSLTVNAGSLAGGTIAITWDVYGKRYIGLGGNVGKSATLVSGSFTVNWVIQSTQPDAKTLEGYCSGWGINVGAGNGLGGGITKVPGQAHSVLGVGVYTPQAGASVVYPWKVYDPNDPKPKPTNPADAYRYHPYVPGSVRPPNPSYRP